MGADRPLAISALVIPSSIASVVGAVTAVGVAVALSSRFPLGTARDYDLDVGTHADWVVLGIAAVGVLAAVLADRRRRRVVAGDEARARDRASVVRRSRRGTDEPCTRAHDRRPPRRRARTRSTCGPGALRARGRDRRGDRRRRMPHVPRRHPGRGPRAGRGPASCGTSCSRPAKRWCRRRPSTRSPMHRDVAAALDARWERAVPVDGRPTPMFGIRTVKGSLPLVVLHGRAPDGPDEIAFAPTTMRSLRLSIGDRVRVGGDGGPSVTVVGEALLPATSHTDYDQSGWMTAAGLTRVVGPPSDNGEDYLLLKWAPGADVAAAERRVTRIGGSDLFAQAALLPTAVADLARIESLPLALGAFFALLACATVAHALVTTVRRRRRDLAVLRADRVHAPSDARRDRLAGDAARGRRHRRRRPARHRGRPHRLALARRRLPDRLRAAGRTARRVRGGCDRDRGRQRARGRTRARGDPHPAGRGAPGRVIVRSVASPRSPASSNQTVLPSSECTTVPQRSANDAMSRMPRPPSSRRSGARTTGATSLGSSTSTRTRPSWRVNRTDIGSPTCSTTFDTNSERSSSTSSATPPKFHACNFGRTHIRAACEDCGIGASSVSNISIGPP